MRWSRLLSGVLGAGLLGTAALPAAPAGALTTGSAQSSQAGPSPGVMQAWGGNFYGQLGNGANGTERSYYDEDENEWVSYRDSDANTNTPVPAHLPVGVTVTAIAGGYNHSLALTSDGRVFAWGANDRGQLGNGTGGEGILSNTPVPVHLPAGVTVTAIAVGWNHSLARTSDGRVLAWGANDRGQLGDGTNTDRNSPVYVSLPADVTVTAIGGGWQHSLARTLDGRVFAWGANDRGQLGDGTGTDTDTPVYANLSALPAGVTVTEIGAGGLYSLALASDGRVLSWGFNYNGQLGNGASLGGFTPQAIPDWVLLPANVRVTAIAPGYAHALALTSDDEVYSWGINGSGTLGIGTSGTGTDMSTPVQVHLPPGVTVTAIAANGYHSLALSTDGRVLAWGSNGTGQLGTGTTGGSQSTPVQVHQPSGTTVTSIAAGWSFTLAIITRRLMVLDWTIKQLPDNDYQYVVRYTFDGWTWSGSQATLENRFRHVVEANARALMQGTVFGLTDAEVAAKYVDSGA